MSSPRHLASLPSSAPLIGAGADESQSSRRADGSPAPDASDDELADLTQLDRQLPCLPFELGNPAVELIEGRLFLSGSPPPMKRDEDEDEGSEEEEEGEEEGRLVPPENVHHTTLVALFDIPAHITLSELHSFLLDSPCFPTLLHMQLIRLPSRHQSSDPTYAALLQFRTPADATAFVGDAHGVAFNSLEPDVCMTGFVVRVTFDEEERYAFPLPSSTHSSSSYGGVAHSAGTPVQPASSASSPALQSKQTMLAKQISREGGMSPSMRSIPSPSLMSAAAGTHAANSMLLPPCAPSFATTLSGSNDAAAAAMLPSCPVCLESIQPAATASQSHHTPMLTILCHHVFHLACLSQWIPSSSSSSCPVCRYRLQPSVHTQCHTCKATDRLWMCIVCGHVGCSRYALAHARAHFEETSHNYALEVTTQRVWDYAADCYVHRLIHNKTDGKLVELARADMLEDDRSESTHAGAGAGGAGSAHCNGGKSSSLSSLSLTSSATSSSAAAAAAAAGAGGRSLVIPPTSSAYASVKLEEFILEYNYLLSSQLGQQREVFQRELRRTQGDMTQRRQEGEQALAKEVAAREATRTKLNATLQRCRESEARLEALRASHASLEAQSAQLQSLHTKLLSNHSSLRSSRESATSLYVQQQDALISEQDAQIASLEDQLHDLRFFVDTQRQIDRMDARAGKLAGKPSLRDKLKSGQAELQLVEVAPEEDEGKRKNRRKRG